MTPQNGNLRPDTLGWKVIRFPLTRILLAGVAVSLVVAGVQTLVIFLGKTFALKTNAPGALFYYGLYLGFSVLAAGLTYQGYVHLVERRTVNELGRPGAGSELITGAALGMGLMAMIVGILWLLGLYRVTGVNDRSLLVAALANDAAGAFFEEILFRAIFFRIVEEVVGSWWALWLSALLFGAIHLLNPQATLISALAVGVEASFLLGAAYMLSRRLWLAVGIHTGWDFVQVGIFGAGVTVAGESTPGLLQGQLSGPTFLSGGALGVEASVVALVLALAVGALLLVQARQRGHIIKPNWQVQKGRY